MENQENFSEKDSLKLITNMLQVTKNGYLDTGRAAILWGGIITICGILTYLKTIDMFPKNIDVWMLTIFALIPQFIIVYYENIKTKTKYFDEKFLNTVWVTFGISMFALQFSFGVFQAKLIPILQEYKQLSGHSSGFQIWSFFTPITLIIYAIPTFITGWVKKFKHMFIGGIICFVCSIISAYTNLGIDMLLIALSATTAWLIPGILLNRKYVKQKSKNV